jgi:hypothetical protein
MSGAAPIIAVHWRRVMRIEDVRRELMRTL